MVRNILRMAFKRLFAQRGMALATALGLVVAIGLVLSIPLYADAVYFRILRTEVAGEHGAIDQAPLAFRFRYTGARTGTLEWAAIADLESYFTNRAEGDLGLQAVDYVHHFKTELFRIYAADADLANDKPLTFVSFGTLNDLEKHIRVLEGAIPPADISERGRSIDVLIHDDLAYKFGWQVGETYLVTRGISVVPVRVAGVWAPLDGRADIWSAPLEELLLVPEENFINRVSRELSGEIYLGIWRITLDGGKLHVGDIAGLLERIQVFRGNAEAALENVILDGSPVKVLENYQRGVPELMAMLFSYSIPIIGLLLAFITLVVGLYVGQQRNEIAVLRSRGATVVQVLGIAAIEGLLLGAMALLGGTPLGEGIAQLIGRSRSFLDFTAPPDLRVSMTAAAFLFGVGAVLLALVAQLIPTFGAARHTILTYKAERARSLGKPAWQRFYLDVILFVPVLYGGYLLQNQGTITFGADDAADIFQNPLLFLTPALGLLALSLFIMRLIPLFMRAFAWVTSKTNSVGLLMAARYLGRAPNFYNAPLMLLTLTLSLSAFTASLAQTLDNHLYKTRYYHVGADLYLEESGISSGLSASGGAARWFFRPVEWHLRAPGVTGATRVGRYNALVSLNKTSVNGVFLGVDRLEFPGIAYWQDDFAAAPLGELMNALATNPDAVLVPRSFAQQNGFKVGDTIPVTVKAYDRILNLSAIVAGEFDFFPTWYPPQDGVLLVGNLENLYDKAGMEFPYNVWLRTEPGADPERIVAYVQGLTRLLDPTVDPESVVDDGLNIIVNQWRSAPLAILQEQVRPQRQGLFGLLSVGFSAAALLTVLGFFLYALFSFRRRFIELGILRAIGLNIRQMGSLLAWELAFLLLVGMGAGTGLGALASGWFIPYLQVGGDLISRYPPFMVELSWFAILRVYVLFGLLFIGALAGLTALLVRMKIFQAVKLGETS